MMRKLIGILLTVVMLLACVPVLAEEAEPWSSFYEEIGMDIDIDKILENSHNYVALESLGVFSHTPYGALIMVHYYPIPMDTWWNLVETFEENTPEEQAAIIDSINALQGDIGLIVVSDTSDFDALGLQIGDAKTEEVTARDGWHYYYVTLSPEDILALYDDPEAAGLNLTAEEAGAEKTLAEADIERVHAQMKGILRDDERVTPQDPNGRLIGQKLQFETTDLDGNAVRSEDLFRDNRITMVNVWGTWCYNCVDEMAELARLHTAFREKGCGIVGVEFENGNAVENFKADSDAILSENGVSYPNVLLPEDNPVFQQIDMYPTSYFVDNEGTIMSTPIVGASLKEYESTLDKLLAGEAVEPTDDTAANGDGRYTVHVFDKDGKPVPGVVLQLCDEDSCAYQATDDSGVAVFEVDEAKVYEVHVLQAPEGFLPDAQVYKTLDTWSDVAISLEREK